MRASRWVRSQHAYSSRPRPLAHPLIKHLNRIEQKRTKKNKMGAPEAVAGHHRVRPLLDRDAGELVAPKRVLQDAAPPVVHHEDPGGLAICARRKKRGERGGRRIARGSGTRAPGKHLTTDAGRCLVEARRERRGEG